jgi:hypothetical protein
MTTATAVASPVLESVAIEVYDAGGNYAENVRSIVRRWEPALGAKFRGGAVTRIHLSVRPQPSQEPYRGTCGEAAMMARMYAVARKRLMAGEVAFFRNLLLGCPGTGLIIFQPHYDTAETESATLPATACKVNIVWLADEWRAEFDQADWRVLTGVPGGFLGPDWQHSAGKEEEVVMPDDEAELAAKLDFDLALDEPSVARYHDVLERTHHALVAKATTAALANPRSQSPCMEMTASIARMIKAMDESRKATEAFYRLSGKRPKYQDIYY